MSKPKKGRTTPRIAGCPVYGADQLAAAPGKSVYKHSGKYHVFVELKEVMVTDDLQLALTEAAKVAA